MNLTSALWLGYVAYRSDRTRWRIFGQTVAAYLLLITPYFGIVQLDLFGTVALATGAWLLLAGPACPRRGWRLLAGALALTVAVSTRPQFALILWALVALLVFVMLLRHQWRERLQARAYLFERVAYRTLCGLILLFAVLTALRAIRVQRWLPLLLLSGWVTAFWAVHAVFEIQERYFLGLYLVIPVLCGLLWREREAA